MEEKPGIEQVENARRGSATSSHRRASLASIGNGFSSGGRRASVDRDVNFTDHREGDDRAEAAKGRDSSAMKDNYWYSPNFIGTLLAIGFSFMAGIGGKTKRRRNEKHMERRLTRLQDTALSPLSSLRSIKISVLQLTSPGFLSSTCAVAVSSFYSSAACRISSVVAGSSSAVRRCLCSGRSLDRRPRMSTHSSAHKSLSASLLPASSPSSGLWPRSCL